MSGLSRFQGNRYPTVIVQLRCRKSVGEGTVYDPLDVGSTILFQTSRSEQMVPLSRVISRTVSSQTLLSSQNSLLVTEALELNLVSCGNRSCSNEWRSHGASQEISNAILSGRSEHLTAVVPLSPWLLKSVVWLMHWRRSRHSDCTVALTRKLDCDVIIG